jgi:hypothetical protein
MIIEAYCPVCDINYKLKLDIDIGGSRLNKAFVCYSCGGPADEYPGDLSSTTEDLAEADREEEEASFEENLVDVLFSNLNGLVVRGRLTRDDIFGILEEERQKEEAAETTEIYTLEPHLGKRNPPLFRVVVNGISTQR